MTLEILKTGAYIVLGLIIAFGIFLYWVKTAQAVDEKGEPKK